MESGKCGLARLLIIRAYRSALCIGPPNIRLRSYTPTHTYTYTYSFMAAAPSFILMVARGSTVKGRE